MNDTTEKRSHCARCRIPREERICLVENGRGPDFCPTRRFAELIDRIQTEYQKPEFKEFARMATVQEAECYQNRKPAPYVLQPSKCRIQETIEFAKKLDFKKLGLAFCGGLEKEAGMLTDVLEDHGFDVSSVGCNVGGVRKEAIGIEDDQKVKIGTRETMCNPLLQAEVLNEIGTDLNILLGLCVGHDALFLKKARAFCTVLAAKDRVTAHNPLAALYTIHSYYRKLRHPDIF